MDKLYEIFSQISNTNWNLRCIIHVLRELEDAVPKESDMEKLIGFCLYYLDHIENDVEDWIQKLDIYTLSVAKESSISDQKNKKIKNTNEYHALYQEILMLKSQDASQLVHKSETAEEKEFFELIRNYLLQKEQERL